MAKAKSKRKSTKTGTKKKPGKRSTTTKKARKLAEAGRTIVAPTFIKGDRWISWKQGGEEFLLKASTIGRIRDDPRGGGIVVTGAGGDLRIDTTMSLFVFAMETE